MSYDSRTVYIREGRVLAQRAELAARGDGVRRGTRMNRSTATAAPDPLWTAADVARFLNASQSYVYKAAEAGRLPCIRIGAMLRFDPARIRQLVCGGAKEPSP
jgi:excisionase family DNA binding protein